MNLIQFRKNTKQFQMYITLFVPEYDKSNSTSFDQTPLLIFKIPIYFFFFTMHLYYCNQQSI